MNKQHEHVLDKLISQCRKAHLAQTPLIMVDTDETELMDRLAEQSKLVDLVEKKYIPEKRNMCYYEYVGAQPSALDRSENFSCDPNALDELIQHGYEMDYKKPPQMAVLHLPWKKNGLESEHIVEVLRKYVHAYVHCKDDQSALRSSCVLLYGDPAMLPKDLLIYTEVFTVEYPEAWEIAEILDDMVKKSGILQEIGENELNKETREAITKSMAGFGLIEVERYIKRMIRADEEDGKKLIFSTEARESMLLDAKEQTVRRAGGILQLYRDKREKKEDLQIGVKRDLEAGDHENKLGGMGAYKVWVEQAGDRMKNYYEYARDRGVPALKGVLLCGVPGCGKSEAAKILYRQWGLPMLRLDIDQLMGGLVGDSERNMRKALAQAEAMAPCILWIDELEKGFSGATAVSNDGGTFKRMFGRLLTWMQENKKPCFIFATANDISALPPEFFRSGRFDALFAVYMPTYDECKEIFAEQMRRADELRRDMAEKMGASGKDLSPLFNNDPEQGCFTERTLQIIMDLFMEGKNPDHPKGIKFLSGADIQKITNTALARLSSDELEKPLEASEWIEALREVVSDPAITTLGSANSNLDQIAVSYVRLMRQNFAPASAENQLLFRSEDYRCESREDNSHGNKITVNYVGQCTLTAPYDRALFNALRSRIERIGSQLEIVALNRMCQ